MISRFITFSIIAFWLLMTWLLVQTVYFPSESRFAEADPEYVIGLFLRNSLNSDLTIYKDNKKVGEIDLAPRRVTLKDKETGASQPGYALRMNATGDVALPNLPEQTLKWDADLRFDTQWNLHAVDLTVRFSEPEDIKIEVEIHPRTAEFDYRVFRGGIEVQLEKDVEAGKNQMRLLLMTWGINPEALDDTEIAAREQERLSNMSARHGNIEISGRRFHAWILKLQVLAGGEMKFYFTDDGQIVKVTTFLGYEALSEVVDPRQKIEDAVEE